MLVDKLTDVKLAFDGRLLTVLGVVLGLVVSFRTSSAYEHQRKSHQAYLLIERIQGYSD